MVDPEKELPRTAELSDRLERSLRPLGFEPRVLSLSSGVGQVAGAWVRKTWNTNRAVVHLCAPPGAGELGEFTRAIRFELGRSIGYFPFFYGLGLQVVWSGYDTLERASHLERGVDRIDNQLCIVQSVFVGDWRSNRFRQARTWGQVITGSFQDAIASSLQEVFAASPR